MSSVVKVQRPITSTDPNPHWLIYDKSRKRLSAISEAHISHGAKKMMGTDLKAFFLGSWNKKTQTWAITKRVAESKGF